MAQSTAAAAAQERVAVLARQLCAGATAAPSPLLRADCSASASSSSQRLLEGQVAIITGAGKGIGEASARLLASHGAAIVVADLDAAAAQAVTLAIQDEGGRAVAVAGDITDPECPRRIVEAALSAFGDIHIIVNNAGFTWDGVIHKTTPQQWDTMLAVHCTAPFKLIQAAAEHIREAAKREAAQDGEAKPRVILNISSTSGTHGNAGQANYATAKAGVIGLTKAVAKEWGPLNVRCNAIAFGLIDTRLTRSKGEGNVIEVAGRKVALGIPAADSYWQQVKAMVPLRRVGSAAEAAGSVLLLASPWASYVTGQVLEVNGGSFM